MDARKAQVALFLAAILAPGVANLLGVDGADSEGENRAMADLPRLEWGWTSWASFPGRFTTWFEDHFAFRAALVRAASAVRYFGLGVSPSSGVVKAGDDWLFYGGDSGMDDYVRQSPLRADQVEDWRESLVRSHDWLHTQGIAFVFAIAPDKHVLYPELLPASIRPVGRTYRMDQLFDSLRGTGVAAVDFRRALAAAKEQEPLYEKTDTHWNERGAFVAYGELVSAVRAQVPTVPPAWTRDDFDAVVQVTDGMDLAGMIGLKGVLHEMRYRLLPRRPRRARVVDPPGEVTWANVGRLVTEIPGSTLPRAVVFRDSFASRLAPYLSEHFSRVVYLWQNNFDAGVIRDEHPDVVIQEIVGRHLLYISPYSSAPAAPALRLARVGSQSK
jgi:hypothetical protein